MNFKNIIIKDNSVKKLCIYNERFLSNPVFQILRPIKSVFLAKILRKWVRDTKNDFTRIIYIPSHFGLFKFLRYVFFQSFITKKLN